jgi:undecaprenyl diphosphate synthase
VDAAPWACEGQALKRTVEAAPRFGIRCLTVFGFSTENWSRPADEVSDLMGLVRSYVASDLKRLERAGVRVRVLGRRAGLPADIIAIIDRAEASTAHNEKFLLQVAFNYGGRADILDAARRHVDAVLAGRATRAAGRGVAGSGPSTAGAPPVDVIVRTSGEQRLSNFLLWEAAYAELVYQNVSGPTTRRGLADVIEQYRNRDRRFGGGPANRGRRPPSRPADGVQGPRHRLRAAWPRAGAPRFCHLGRRLWFPR